MTLIDEIMSDIIEPALLGITVANGYLNDVSVLPGYMVHYANDLLSGKDGVSFPCVASEPKKDLVEQSKGGKKAKIGRIEKVIGAVNATDRATVKEKLNALVFDVRRALSVDNLNETTKLNSVIIGDCEYALPDSKEQYAYFEMEVTINYIEDWN